MASGLTEGCKYTFDLPQKLLSQFGGYVRRADGSNGRYPFGAKLHPIRALHDGL
jgi:hypothetical protein